MEAICDGCGSTDIDVSVKPVRPHGERFVMTCQACGTGWMTTEPSVSERVLLAAVIAKRDSEQDERG